MQNFWELLDRVTTSPAGRTLAAALRHTGNVVFPNPCALCVWSDAEVHQLCVPCTALIKHQCHQIIQAQDYADALPLDLVTGLPLPVFAGSLYTPEMARIILKFKDHQQLALRGMLRPILYRIIAHAQQQLDAAALRVVAIPASGASLRRRGYNPVEVMLPRDLPAGCILDTRLLHTRWQLRNNTAHHGTGVQQRRAAARNKFRLGLRRTPPAEPVLLVDDVLTSGATLAAATRLLQMDGYDVVGAVVCSAVAPRS